MKKAIYTLVFATGLISIASCGGDKPKTDSAATTSSGSAETAAPAGNADNGKKLFTDKGCVACHNADTKVVGPSLKDIAAAYVGKEGQMTSFLKEESQAIVDPSQYATMQASLAITKAMSAQELNDVVSFISSHK